MGRSRTRRAVFAEDAGGGAQGAKELKEDDSTFLTFGRKLAAHDRVTRDKAVSKLRRFLGNAQDKAPGDLAQVWEGLYYCLYHSDRPGIQQELARVMGALVHAVKPAERALDFVAASLRVLQHHWQTVDRLRQDKFMSLVRRIVHEAFVRLRSRGWDETEVERFCELLIECPLQPRQTPGQPETLPQPGLQFHIADLYWEELFLASPRGSVPGNIVVALIRPWVNLVARCDQPHIRKRISSEVFDTLLVDWLRGEQDADAEASEQPVAKLSTDENAGVRAAQWLPTPLKRIAQLVFDYAGSEERCVDAARGDVYRIYRMFQRKIAQMSESHLSLCSCMHEPSTSGKPAESSSSGEIDGVVKAASNHAANLQQPAVRKSKLQRKRSKRAADDNNNGDTASSRRSTEVVEEPIPTVVPAAKRQRKEKAAATAVGPEILAARGRPRLSLTFDLKRNETREFSSSDIPKVSHRRSQSASPRSKGILKPAVPLKPNSPWAALHASKP